MSKPSFLVVANFLPVDVKAILSIPIPQRNVQDRVAWTGSNTGMYSAKEGYKFWVNQNCRNLFVTQCNGWKRLWTLLLPHKIKIFIWRFCRNTIPVRARLSAKGVRVPITCPMCSTEIEHLLHVFFDCGFASNCWRYAGLVYDMRLEEDAPRWLMHKLSNVGVEEANIICTVLWGIWIWRNKRVWEGQTVTAAIAMGYSFQHVEEWRSAITKVKGAVQPENRSNRHHNTKWKPPATEVVKVNVDASFIPNSDNFKVGMCLRNHAGEFLAGRTSCFQMVDTVLEAEAIGVREALSWIKSLQLANRKVELESDSLLVLNGVLKRTDNLLEVGEVFEQIKILLEELVDTSIHFVRNQANRLAHEIARLPCLVNYHNVFSSLPDCLVETVTRDLPGY